MTAREILVEAVISRTSITEARRESTVYLISGWDFPEREEVCFTVFTSDNEESSTAIPYNRLEPLGSKAAAVMAEAVAELISRFPLPEV